MAAMVGVYGPRSLACQVIGGVKRMHAGVGGETLAGEPYRALDPEQLNWVAATAQYGFLKAYDRFVTPQSGMQRRRFWAEGREVAQLYGMTEFMTSDDEFLEMMERLLPRFEAHPFNRARPLQLCLDLSIDRWQGRQSRSFPMRQEPGCNLIPSSISR